MVIAFAFSPPPYFDVYVSLDSSRDSFSCSVISLIICNTACHTGKAADHCNDSH